MIGQIFGCTAKSLTGKSLRDLFPASLQTAEHARYLEEMLTGKAKPRSGLVLAGLHTSAQQMPLLVSLSETRSEGRRLLIAVLRHATLGERICDEASAEGAVSNEGSRPQGAGTVCAPNTVV